ncbi:MAG: HU family DNA-binding protein [Muribaculaceae bacterium]|nr:HU family DNA-binding protein [Muribaculaceae bacterium]
MEDKLTVGSLASNLAGKTGKGKKLCDDFLREFFRLVSESLSSGETLRIKNFGTFKVVDVESRMAVNINTGDKQEIPAHKKVVFTPAKEMASEINAPFEEFESVELDSEMPEDLIYLEEPGEEAAQNSEAQSFAEDNGASGDEQKMSDENEVSQERLEEGSMEEGSDDEITYEAYHIQEPNTQEPQVTEEKVHETPVVAPVYESYEPEAPKSRFGIGFLTGSLSMLVVCVVIFMLGCFFQWWPVNFGSPSKLEEIALQEVPVETVSAETPEEIPEPEPIYDTVSTTRYLTTIAREHYGNFNFWPYIYIENESILGHPDRIKPGTQVIVPDLAKYGVNPENKADEQKAKEKAREIYSKFK